MSDEDFFLEVTDVYDAADLEDILHSLAGYTTEQLAVLGQDAPQGYRWLANWPGNEPALIKGLEKKYGVGNVTTTFPAYTLSGDKFASIAIYVKD